MNATSIRLAEASDLDILCDLYYAFHDFHAQYLPTYLRPLGQPSALQRDELSNKIKTIINGVDSAILVADCSRQVVGMVEIYLKHPNSSIFAAVPRLYTHLQSLFVIESFRRRGIGKQLLQAAEAWALARKANELRMDIWEFPAGPLEFYEKSGYLTFRRSMVKKFIPRPS
jgi:GNAT superfamily N-acetyltransferase